MQLIFQAKDYFERRKRRKQQKQEQQHETPQQHHHLQYGHHYDHHSSTPVTTHLQSLPAPHYTAVHAPFYAPMYPWPPYAYNHFGYPPPPLQLPWRPSNANCHCQVHHGHPPSATSSSRSIDQFGPHQAGHNGAYAEGGCDAWHICGQVDELAPLQEAPSHANSVYDSGMCTGRDPNPRNSLSLARNHWSSFQQVYFSPTKF
ncbi:hypothetical protein L7F22_021615 [Adiantum nelumboides]|nr:hypothetical protein [Adiantum nelumboides]